MDERPLPSTGNHFEVRCVCGNVLETCRCPSPVKSITTRSPCSCTVPFDKLVELMDQVDDTQIVSVIWRDDGVEVDHQGMESLHALGLLVKGAVYLALAEFGYFDDDEDEDEEPDTVA